MALRLSILLTLCLSVAGTAGAATIVYQEGAPDPFLGGVYAGTEDTMMIINLGGQTGDNYGGRINLDIGPANSPGARWNRHSLIRFDVSSLAGKFASIDAVTLRLHEDTPGGVAGYGGSGVVQLHRFADANADWIEGTGSGTQQSNRASWVQKRRFFANWAGSQGASTPGVDYVAAPLGTAPWVPSTTTIDLAFNDPSIVLSWIGGTNAGLFLRAANESIGSRWNFHSSESPSAALRPQLIIEYTPLAAPIPEPSTGALVLGTLALGAVVGRRRTRAASRCGRRRRGRSARSSSA